jgi:hypothetical protein
LLKNNYRIIAYKAEGNLGNTIQTLGLANLISPSKAVWWREIGKSNFDDKFIANGWFSHKEIIPVKRTIFCGIHISGNINTIHPSIIEWLKHSDGIVGTRDPMTSDFLNGIGINSIFVGCSSLLFPKYDGRRSGETSVDFDGPGKKMTHHINLDCSWEDKWEIAKEMIEIYKKSEVVYTSRLHVALPCLALGTPVVVSKNTDTRRFSILDFIGIEYEKVQIIDISYLRNKYKSFLEDKIGEKLELVEPTIPL